MRKAGLIFVCVAVLAGIWFWPQTPIRHRAGVRAARAEPVQTAAPSSRPWSKGTYTVAADARFDITAVVLSKAHYWADREAQLAPYDLALGWGPMSDQGVIDTLDISQTGRWYFYRFTSRPCPIDKTAIDTHSGNMHMIPADDRVLAALGQVRVGQVVHIQGLLVHVTAPDGWHWQSSLSRTDTGPGACELVWVESVAGTEEAGEESAER